MVAPLENTCVTAPDSATTTSSITGKLIPLNILPSSKPIQLPMPQSALDIAPDSSTTAAIPIYTSQRTPLLNASVALQMGSPSIWINSSAATSSAMKKI